MVCLYVYFACIFPFTRPVHFLNFESVVQKPWLTLVSWIVNKCCVLLWFDSNSSLLVAPLVETRELHIWNNSRNQSVEITEIAFLSRISKFQKWTGLPFTSLCIWVILNIVKCSLYWSVSSRELLNLCQEIPDFWMYRLIRVIPKEKTWFQFYF